MSAALALYAAWRSSSRQLRTLVSRTRGTLLEAGLRERSASTGTKEHGTLIPGMGTSAECSSFSPRGVRSAEASVLILPLHASSFIVRGVSTNATATVGVSGVPPERAA